MKDIYRYLLIVGGCMILAIMIVAYVWYQLVLQPI